MKTLEVLSYLSDSMIPFASTDLPLFLCLHLQLVSLLEDIWAGMLSQCMSYVCLQYINHDSSEPSEWLFCHCNMQQFPLPADHPNMVQSKMHWIQKEFYCTQKKTKHAKTQKNKSQRATEPDTKVSGSANRIWKKPLWWLLINTPQTSASCLWKPSWLQGR